jgi:hypothetical protein
MHVHSSIINECGVCQDYCSDINHVPNIFTKCPYNHYICKNCYLSILQMCYCENKLGEIIYKCPLCRNQHNISNNEMNSILLTLFNTDIICIKVHKTCERRDITKKCQFENCGCRTNIVDIITDNELDISIQDIINAANNYPVQKKIPSPSSKYLKKHKSLFRISSN